MATVLLAIGLFFATTVSYAAPSFVVPSATSPVQDEAHVLSSSTVRRLSQLLQDLHSKGGSQIAVLTVPTLGDLTIEEASIKVVDAWKLGRRDKDDGVLLMIAPNDLRVRIEVGQGREGQLTDAYSRRIINEVLAPAFKQGDFDTGVTQAVVAIISVTDPDYVRSRRRELTPMQGMGVLILMVLFVVFFVIARILQFFGLMPRSSYYGSSGWSGSGWGGGGGGFGGGSGGWGGGGGGFSGGGSSGSW